MMSTSAHARTARRRGALTVLLPISKRRRHCRPKELEARGLPEFEAVRVPIQNLRTRRASPSFSTLAACMVGRRRLEMARPAFARMRTASSMMTTAGIFSCHPRESLSCHSLHSRLRLQSSGDLGQVLQPVVVVLPQSQSNKHTLVHIR